MVNEERLYEEMNHCSRCGTCLAHCPVYREILEEQYVGRSKVFLFRALWEGKLDTTGRLGQIFDLCLLCRSCTAACPNGVRVDLLVEAVRQRYTTRHGLSVAKRTVLRLLGNERSIRPALQAGHLYQSLGLEGMLRRFPFLRETVPALANAVDYVPKLEGRPLTDQYPEVIGPDPESWTEPRPAKRGSWVGGEETPTGDATPVKKSPEGKVRPDRPRARVGYFVGCGTNYFRPQTGRATIEVLRHNGYEVVIPEQSCCGLPALAAGDRKKAREMAQANLKYFLAADVDFIVTDCASCGSTLKEYGEILDDPAVGVFTGRVRDINEFLVREGHRLPEGRVKKKVTYHDPCHLKRAQGIHQEPRQLLGEIPALQFQEMAEADRCCGGGGTFAVSHWDIAQKIGRRKVENIRATEAEVVATACPGCALQIEASLRGAGLKVEVRHTVELLAEAYREEKGISPAPAASGGVALK